MEFLKRRLVLKPFTSKPLPSILLKDSNNDLAIKYESRKYLRKHCRFYNFNLS